MRFGIRVVLSVNRIAEKTIGTKSCKLVNSGAAEETEEVNCSSAG